MFNYLKFAIFQIIGFISSLPLVRKFTNSPQKYSNEEKFEFLQSQATKSLDLVNIKLNILGKERVPKEPVLFVINHSSMLDSFILISSIPKPVGVVIADVPTWRNIPIVKHWIDITKSVYINRENNREGIKSINKCAENIKEGQSMAIFPEGDLTWVKDPKSLVSDFKAGALKIAYKAKCPIVPMVIKNSLNTYEGYEPIGKINSKDVEVEFLDPIYEHLENPRLKTVELAKTIKEKMIDEMQKYQSKNPVMKQEII